jgi:hypothetical protein
MTKGCLGQPFVFLAVAGSDQSHLAHFCPLPETRHTSRARRRPGKRNGKWLLTMNAITCAAKKLKVANRMPGVFTPPVIIDNKLTRLRGFHSPH